jgi:hypothetical protein
VTVIRVASEDLCLTLDAVLFTQLYTALMAAAFGPSAAPGSSRRGCFYATVLLVSALLVAGTLAGSHTAEAAEGAERRKGRAVAFRLTASGWLASATGRLQTPAGGGLGTISYARPRLEEIGLDGLSVLPIVAAQLFFLRDHEIHANFFYLALNGNAVLGPSLVSQGVFFPADSSVDSRLRLPFARIGYRAHWLPLKWGDGWSVAPEVGFGYFDFHYKLESPSATGRVDRSYGVGFPYLGLQLGGPLTERLQFEAEVLGSGVSTA